MKLFVVLSCAVALAAARPGYTYERQNGGAIIGGNGFSNGGFNGDLNIGAPVPITGFAPNNGFSSIGGGANFQQQARVVTAGPVLVGGGGFNGGQASTFIGNGFANGFNDGQATNFIGNGFNGQQQGAFGGSFSSNSFGNGFSNGGNGFSIGGNGFSNGNAAFVNGGSSNFGGSAILAQPAVGPAFNPGPTAGPAFNPGPTAGPAFISRPAVAPSAGPAFVAGPTAGPTVIQKHIYVHVPPQDQEEIRQQQTHFLPAAPAQKHYKIIFIKTPTVHQNNAALIQQAAAAQNSEKTLIYVLVKKPEDVNQVLLQQAAAAQIQPSKPEVYFIKYKSRGNQNGGGIGGGIAGGNGGGIIGGVGSGNGVGIVGGQGHVGGIINEGSFANIGASGSGNLIAPAISLGESHQGIGLESAGIDIRHNEAGSGVVLNAQQANFQQAQPHTDYGTPRQHH